MTKVLRAAIAIGLTLALAIPADARVGGGSSSGSRGSRTFSAPAPTSTAPQAAQPMQRTESPSSAQRPGMAGASQAAQPRRFGFGTGLMAGLLGAGLLGMLTGHGFMGGLSGLASLFGLLAQVALVGGLIWLALRFFRRRSEPALAGAGASYGRSAPGGLPGGGGAVPAGSSGVAGGSVQVGPADFAAFERSLQEIQAAYSRENMEALSHLATPEMLRYFGADLEENRRRGLRDEVSAVTLRQGDLSEAWREGAAEYATVAMRFGFRGAMVDRATGRVSEGDPTRDQEATELWTFQRQGGSPWVLSAIQQTA